MELKVLLFSENSLGKMTQFPIPSNYKDLVTTWTMESNIFVLSALNYYNGLRSARLE